MRNRTNLSASVDKDSQAGANRVFELGPDFAYAESDDETRNGIKIGMKVQAFDYKGRHAEVQQTTP